MTADRYDLTRHETLKTPGRRRNEWRGGTNPTVSDDSSREYEAGSRWINVMTGEVWTCLDATVGAANWKRGTGQAHDELSELGDDDHPLYGLVYSQADPPDPPDRPEALWINTVEEVLYIWEPVSDTWVPVTAGYAPVEHPHNADEVAYDDDAGDFPLPVITAFLRPNGDAETTLVDWTNSSTQQAWQQVNEAVVNTANYVTIHASGGVVRLTLDDFPGLPTDRIRQVRVGGYMSVGSGTDNQQMVMHDGDSGSSASAATGILWTTGSSGARVGPWLTTCWWDGADWTPERLAALQVRVQHNSTHGDGVLHQCYVEVEYDAGMTVQGAIEQVAGMVHPEVHAHSLDDLSDVAVAGPADGELLGYVVGAPVAHDVPWPGTPGNTGIVDYCIDAGSAPTIAVPSTMFGSVPSSIDQNVTTRWSSDNSGAQYYRLDFGAASARKVAVTHWAFHAYAADAVHRPRVFTIEGSDDATTWTPIHSRSASIAATGWTGGAVDSPSIGFRYIRFSQPAGGAASGTNRFEFTEVELWGTVYGPDVSATWMNVVLDTGVAEHSDLTGLADDDHLGYGLMFSQASPPAAPARPEAIWIDTDGVPETGGSLGGLTDVDVAGATDGDSLTWDATAGEWVPGPGGGGASALDDLTDVNAPAPAAGDVLTWDDTPGEWVAAVPTGGGGNAVMYSQPTDPGTPPEIEALWYDTDATGGGGGGGPADYVSGLAGSGQLIIPGLASHPDIVPASPSAYDDEFDTTDASDPIAGWTTLGTPSILNANSDFLSHLHIGDMPTGAWEVHGIYKTPPSIPFTVVCKIGDVRMDANFQSYGLMLIAAGPGALMLWSLATISTQQLLRTSWSSRTARSSFYQVGLLRDVRYLKLVVASSTSVACWASCDGLIWMPHETLNPGFTIAGVGLGISGQDNSVNADCAIDWIRFT